VDANQRSDLARRSRGNGHGVTHGATKAAASAAMVRTYSSFKAMIQRTINPKANGGRDWHRYGGANPPVAVCKRWLKFSKFLADLEGVESLAPLSVGSKIEATTSRGTALGKILPSRPPSIGGHMSSKSYRKLIAEQDADAQAKKVVPREAAVVPVVKAQAPVHKEMKEWARMVEETR
jgi:hypothetical protein